jgi:trigger factor
LETSIEYLDGGRARLTITVPVADVDREVSAAYGRIGAKLRIPGFRPGKAPRPVVDTHVGREAVLAEAQEEIVSEAFGMAISAEGVRTYGQPDVGELDLVEPGADYTFTAEVTLRPELALSSTGEFAVTVPSRIASDREVDAQIEHTRERFATLEIVDRPVADGDYVLLSFVGTVDGEAYEGNTVDKYVYETGRGMMPPEFDQALIGTMAGGSTTAEFTIPEGSSEESFVGKTAHFEIEVHEVKAKVLPELDDEFAMSAAGFESMEAYRADVKEKLEAAKAAGTEHRREAEALKALSERLEGEVPQEMVESRASSMMREFFESLEARGIGIQQYVELTGATPEQIQDDMRLQATQRVREELALEALFREKGFEVTDEEFDAAIADIAGEEGHNADKLRAELTRNGVLPLVREQIIHRRALEWLMDNVTITEEDPS